VADYYQAQFAYFDAGYCFSLEDGEIKMIGDKIQIDYSKKKDTFDSSTLRISKTFIGTKIQ
jgi:hypothetical protein